MRSREAPAEDHYWQPITLGYLCERGTVHVALFANVQRIIC